MRWGLVEVGAATHAAWSDIGVSSSFLGRITLPIGRQVEGALDWLGVRFDV